MKENNRSFSGRRKLPAVVAIASADTPQRPTQKAALCQAIDKHASFHAASVSARGEACAHHEKG